MPFHDDIDDYLEMCKGIGKTINQFVNEAINEKLATTNFSYK